jgi:hypothetical protein
MSGELDRKDKNESRKIAIALTTLLLILAVGAILLLPALGQIAEMHMAPGLGLRESAIIAFFVTIVLMIILALVSGDGLLGEVQFIIGAFLLFYLIIWLMMAWIF